MKPILAMPSRHWDTFLCEEAQKRLLEAGFVLKGNETGRKLEREEQKVFLNDAYAVIAGTEPYDADMLSAAKDLKVIVRYGVGLDNFDLNEMRRLGIAVGTISNCNAVAEFTLALMLDTLKCVSACDAKVRAGEWPRLPMRELGGKTVGLVGFGRIGQKVAKLLSGFETDTVAYDPYMNEEAAKALGVRPVTLEELLNESDIVSLHLPASAERKHMVNAGFLARMQDGAYLINTARGVLVDEQAVLEALESGKLAGFGSDVYEKEPATADSPLLKAPRTVLTSHTAALTYETNYNAGLICADSVISVYRGGKPLFPVK